MAEQNLSLRKKNWFGWKQVIALLGAAAYTFSPIDFLPDLIPFVGWVDDLVLDLMTAVFMFNSWHSVRSQMQAQLSRSKTK